MKLSAHTVVVGAGAAGAVVAARLSESAAREVMLLEAGPDYSVEGLPADVRDGTDNALTAHQWGFTHRPTRTQWLPFRMPRGKIVGGSSAVNTCIALRGQPYDYDEWKELGLPEWSFESCLPAFKRLEHDLDFPDRPWHGADGPLPIRRHARSELGPWQAAFLEACAELGYAACDDCNEPNTNGYGMHAMNKVGGERISVARAYLTARVRARPNFTLVDRVLCRRVLFEGKKAIGVEVERDGCVSVVRAKRVVLSTGALATPGILLRSGIGPRAEIERLGVDLVADVPAVGEKLLDHPGLALFFRPKSGVDNPSFPLIQTVLRYASTLCGAGKSTDMQLQPGSFAPGFGSWFPGFGSTRLRGLVSIMCSVGKPRGFGRLRYNSAHVGEKPTIDSNFLSDPHDLTLAREAMRMAERLSETKAMRDLATLWWPRPRSIKDDAGLDATLPKICDSGYHPSGTVPMGAENDVHAATDGRGRVKKVERLYVADASLMPTIPSANIHLASIMIGERFGEWLRVGD